MDKIIRKDAFVHGGKEYEIRVFSIQNGFTVRVFRNNEPATPISYSATWDASVDLKSHPCREVTAIGELMQIAKSDVCSANSGGVPV